MRKDSASQHLIGTHRSHRSMANPSTILVIDDDPNIRESLRMVLRDDGYRVIEAIDGEFGILKAINERPDLIIVDMMMPRVSGFLVTERLKHQHRLTIPIVMLTGNESDHQRSYAEFLGIDAYLNKPVRISHFLDTVHRLCPQSIPFAISEPSVEAVSLH